MFNWKRLFTNFGWAMSMTDPMCYSYYLASRLDSTHGKGTPDVASSRMALARVVEAEGDTLFTIPELQRQTRWLGNEPAPEQEIVKTETRLARRLPPSYRSFMKVSNGFGPVSPLLPFTLWRDEIRDQENR
jgi:hypothetical protein